MDAVRSDVVELSADAADAIVDLVTLCEIAETGEPDPELVDWLRSGTDSPTLRVFGVHDDAGLAAFALLDCAGGHVGLEADVRVRPGVDLDVALPLLRTARELAREFDAAKPLHLFVNDGASNQRRWLEAQGGTEIRHFWRMAIDLDAAPSVPTPGAGVVVRRARDDEADLREIFRIVDVAFAEHFGHTDDRSYDRWIVQWRQRQGFDLGLWWVAELDSFPVAALLGMTVAGDDGVVHGHVGTLGTLKDARGRGIGTLLLHTAFAEFHRRGCRRVTLGVDSENGTGAVRLYESVGMDAVADWALYEIPPLPADRPGGQGPAGSSRSDSNAV